MSWTVLSAQAVTTSRNGIQPSDRFHVVNLRLTAFANRDSAYSRDESIGLTRIFSRKLHGYVSNCRSSGAWRSIPGDELST